jgi:dTMP kinase
MEKGKLIVIEGTDCSGKETQSKKLIERLNNEGVETIYFSYPAYQTPTGRIVGLPYLGKPYLAEELIREYANAVKNELKKKYPEKYSEAMVELTMTSLIEHLSHGWFPEGAPNVDPKISSLYYIADRGYNTPFVLETLEKGTNIILDRYSYSNMAHQGGKLATPEERNAMYEWLNKMEFEMMGLPHSDVKLFLHMPTDYASFLRAGRSEKLDENERDVNHLYNAERAYIEVANRFGFETIECVKKISEEPKFEDIKTPDEIHEEVYGIVKKKLTLK